MKTSLKSRSVRACALVAAASLSIGATGAAAQTSTSQILSPYDQGTSGTTTTPASGNKGTTKKKATPTPKSSNSATSSSATPTTTTSTSTATTPSHLAFTGFDTRIPGVAGLLLISAGGLVFWRRRSGAVS